jgi:hypothetical protein
MNRNETEIIADLSSFGTVVEGRVEEFEDLVSEASDVHSKAMIKPLLLSLDDKCEFDEVMFGVIHTVETFPLREYFEELGRCLSLLKSKSPRWVSILHTRIMNSAMAYQDYLKVYSFLSDEERNALVDLLGSISSKEKFRELCEEGINYIDSLD